MTRGSRRSSFAAAAAAGRSDRCPWPADDAAGVAEVVDAAEAAADGTDARRPDDDDDAVAAAGGPWRSGATAIAPAPGVSVHTERERDGDEWVRDR